MGQICPPAGRLHDYAVFEWVVTERARAGGKSSIELVEVHHPNPLQSSPFRGALQRVGTAPTARLGSSNGARSIVADTMARTHLSGAPAWAPSQWSSPRVRSPFFSGVIQ